MMHPLTHAARRTSAAPDQWEWAAEAGAAIDGLVAAALGTEDPEAARKHLDAAIRGLYALSVAYRGLPGVEAWIATTHRRLADRAAAVLGVDAWKTVPPVHTEPMPMPARGSRPASPFGL